MTRKASALRIGQRYRPERLAGPYDALVVGSGIGGLTVAALLSAIGRKVAVLEQHYTAGGATHSYERTGYEWDVGVHYIGEMGRRTQIRRTTRPRKSVPGPWLTGEEVTSCGVAGAMMVGVG